MNTLIFDIETIPDTESAAKLHELQGLTPQEVAEAIQAMRRGHHASEFLPHHLHKVVAIAAVLRQQDRLHVLSLGEEDTDEAGLLKKFFAGIDKYTPTLVSWNGTGFDLPVLHYRALLHGISAPRYFELGDRDTNFRWNNYLSRYHQRHLDLMDVLALYNPRANAPLNDIAVMLGLPGKIGLHGAKVWEAYQRYDLALIRSYCEVDVLNTYVIFLRFEYMRGRLSLEDYRMECERLRTLLTTENKPHFHTFVRQWQDTL